ncbi:MAG: hypothetical protein ACOX5R_10945 [bacterium]|jgi:hypothetical protein
MGNEIRYKSPYAKFPKKNIQIIHRLLDFWSKINIFGNVFPFNIGDVIPVSRIAVERNRSPEYGKAQQDKQPAPHGSGMKKGREIHVLCK